MRRFLGAALLIFVAACATPATEPADITAVYDAFGEPMTAVDAIPVQTVAAEGSDLIGKPVKLEGRITEVCQGAGCWLSMQVVDGPLVRIDVPRDADGNYVYTFPKDASGRRAVVAGILQGPTDHHAEGEGHDMDMASHHPEGESMGHDGDSEGHHDGDGDASHAEAGHHEGDTDHAEETQVGHDEAETRVLNESVYTLIATGALVERVRA